MLKILKQIKYSKLPTNSGQNQLVFSEKVAQLETQY